MARSTNDDFLKIPIITKLNAVGEFNKLRFAISSMQGWRSKMEDAHTTAADFAEGFEGWSFFALFDGHNGSEVADYCSKYLLNTIVNSDDFRNGEYVRGIRSGFLLIDKAMREMSELRHPKNPRITPGTTVVCAFITSTKVYIAHCGDSRAVLCRQGAPVFNTLDHKPDRFDERRRIVSAGGRVWNKRVNGVLAVSRALGDFDLKNCKTKEQWEQPVSPEPDVFCQNRQDADEFLVMACDGIFDVMSNQRICNFIHNKLQISQDLVHVANQVVNQCLRRGSHDNMTIIIIAFLKTIETPEEAVAPASSDSCIERKSLLKRIAESLTKCLNIIYF